MYTAPHYKPYSLIFATVIRNQPLSYADIRVAHTDEWWFVGKQVSMG